MNEDAAVLMSRDQIALDMLLNYSKLCARAAHEPSRENFAAAEHCRDQILQHSQQQAQILSQMIDRLVLASRVAGGTAQSAPEWEGQQQAAKEAEGRLRALLGVS